MRITTFYKLNVPSYSQEYDLDLRAYQGNTLVRILITNVYMSQLSAKYSSKDLHY